MYHALYRKYRPVDFDSVVGQDVIVRTLRNSIIHNSFSHAYIFYGSRGTGKTTLSKIFARNINCLDSKDGSACGKCDSCKISFSKECVDIIEIDAASNNGVDEIRELRSKISLVPSQLKYKVYIIDEVHMLSTGAFNALLKTLEEPPMHAIFILATTDLQKVPETIVSRCQCFSFKRISNDSIIERLRYVCDQEKIKIDDDVYQDIALSCNGGLRDALGLLDKLTSYSSDVITHNDFLDLNGSISDDQISHFIESIFSNNIYEVLSNINDFHNCGKNFIQIIYQIIDYLRSKIISYYDDSSSLSFSYDYYFELLNYLMDSINDFKRSTNVRLLFEVHILKFIHDTISSSAIPKNTDVVSSRDDSASTVSSFNVISVSNNSSVDDQDEEFDFSKEYDDKDDIVSSSVVSSKSNDFIPNDDRFDSSPILSILNIDEIMMVRINNTFAKADKKLLLNEETNFEKLKDFTFDQEIGYIVCSLLDSKIRVVSEDNIVISFQYDSNVKQNLAILDKITDVYHKITNSNKNFAIISDSKWEELKLEYISNLKNHVSYTILEEPEVLFEENKNNDIINNRAIELFGNDIVEID